MFKLFRKKKFQVSKDTTMGELLKHDPDTAQLLLQYGMHCVGCPSHVNETLEQACAVHGLEPEPLLAALQEYLNNK